MNIKNNAELYNSIEPERTQENSVINSYDSSNGTFIKIGNYIKMPENGNSINLSNNIPLPLIEIKNKCNADFAKKEYCIKLDNEIDILYGSTITLNIILKNV